MDQTTEYLFLIHDGARYHTSASTQVLRIIAAITHELVITRILRHLKLASAPPPIAPARCHQEIFAFN